MPPPSTQASTCDIRPKSSDHASTQSATPSGPSYLPSTESFIAAIRFRMSTSRSVDVQPMIARQPSMRNQRLLYGGRDRAPAGVARRPVVLPVGEPAVRQVYGVGT